MFDSLLLPIPAGDDEILDVARNPSPAVRSPLRHPTKEYVSAGLLFSRGISGGAAAVSGEYQTLEVGAKKE